MILREKYRQEYISWYSMKTRCNNPNYSAYKSYGAVGISVCERWRKFSNFLLDMGEKPSPKHSLDRINSNGNYEPSNCRWADWTQQMNNRRSVIFLTYKNTRLTICQWALSAGIKRATLYQRISNGWSTKDALETPAWGKKSSKK